MSETLLTFDYTLFQQQFPVYANPQTYPESLLQIYWDIAINYISNVGNFGALQGTMRQYAINLMVAHLLYLNFIIGTGNPNTGSQVTGLMQNATIDKVTVGLTPPPVPNQFQWWLNQTPWGQQLLALLQINSVGGFYVGGRGAIAAFGYQGGNYPWV
jgi:hypothetical protein